MHGNNSPEDELVKCLSRVPAREVMERYHTWSLVRSPFPPKEEVNEFLRTLGWTLEEYRTAYFGALNDKK